MATAAIGQICSSASILSNLKICQNLAKKAATKAQVLFLPEASDYIAASMDESSDLAASGDCQRFVTGLQDAARQHQIEISVGVHEPIPSSRKVRNVQLWIDREGRVAHRYQKIHLFDVNVYQGPVIQESKGTEQGLGILSPFKSAIGNVGMLICFDLRFPEVSLALRQRGAEIITYPSAFATVTGQAHWRPLLQARAIETQTFVIAAAQSGSHNLKRKSYGHSLVVDPWGKILLELDDSAEPQLGFAPINIEILKEVRKGMPLARRHDVYPEIL